VKPEKKRKYVYSGSVCQSVVALQNAVEVDPVLIYRQFTPLASS
jgi:hypothetical protein